MLFLWCVPRGWAPVRKSRDDQHETRAEHSATLYYFNETTPPPEDFGNMDDMITQSFRATSVSWVRRLKCRFSPVARSSSPIWDHVQPMTAASKVNVVIHFQGMSSRLLGFPVAATRKYRHTHTRGIGLGSFRLLT